MVRKNLHLSLSHNEWIDKRISETGLTASDIIRRAIDDFRDSDFSRRTASKQPKEETVRKNITITEEHDQWLKAFSKAEKITTIDLIRSIISISRGE